MSRIVIDAINSTLVLATDSGTRIINDLPEGETYTVSFANDASSQTKGINGGTVAKQRADKDTATLKINVLKMSGDDTFLNDLVNSDLSFLNGSLKTNFKRDGVRGTETYDIKNGTIQTRGDGSLSNTDGTDTSEYTILATIKRIL